MKALSLPMFLTIKPDVIEGLTDHLIARIENVTRMKTIILTSNGITRRFPRIIDTMKSTFNDLYVFYVEDSTYENALEAARKISVEDYELVIGIGGGKVLDTTKYAAYVSKKRYISIPTVLSNDGIASPIAVLKIGGGRVKSFGCKIPDGIVIDINVIKNAPIDLLKAGIGDVLSNFTALYDWELSFKNGRAKFDDFAYLLSETALNLILYGREQDIQSDDFIRQLAQALVLSGLAMDISGTSSPCSGSEHLFNHALDQFYDVHIPHGLKVALGTLGSCIFQHRDYSVIVDCLKKYHVNVSPEEIGIDKDTFVGAWMKAKSTRPERFTILDIVDLSTSYLEETYYKISEVLK